MLYEFLNVVVRTSFHRLNPEFGELTMEHQESILPVPQCLEQTLRESILPKAHRDDAQEFRSKNMQMPEVQAALAEGGRAAVVVRDDSARRTRRWASRSGSRRSRPSTYSAPSRARRAPTLWATIASAPSSSADSVPRQGGLNSQKESGGAIEDELGL